MSRLENFGDLFKYSKELLDDDFNAGQQLVMKTKSRSEDGTSELSSTLKHSTPDNSGESKVAFEAKLKSTVKGDSHELGVKQDGNCTWEMKGNQLQTYQKGLQYIVNTTTQAIPSGSVPVIKAGLEFNNSQAKAKLLFNLRSLALEHNLTYLARSNLIVGYNLLLDSRTQNLEKYDFGLSWETAPACYLGLKHESNSKNQLQVGNVFLYFHHIATLTQTVGTEFALDYQKKLLTARFGYSHKFNDDSSAKFRVNHHGFLDATFKHRVSSSLTLGVVSGFNLKAAVAEQKSKNLPFGLQFDFKF
eukprot:403339679